MFKINISHFEASPKNFVFMALWSAVTGHSLFWTSTAASRASMVRTRYSPQPDVHAAIAGTRSVPLVAQHPHPYVAACNICKTRDWKQVHKASCVHVSHTVTTYIQKTIQISHWQDIIVQEVCISPYKWVKTNQNRQTDLPHPARMFQSHSSARTGCGQVTVCVHTNSSHCVQRCQNLSILELWQ